MVRDLVAPWAQLVLHTVDDLVKVDDSSARYELVQGRLVREPPAGFEHGSLASDLLVALRAYVDHYGVGRVLAAETGFLLSAPGEPDTVMAPDVAFVSAARLPAPTTRDWTGYPRLAPDLVIEIASPDQHRPEMAAKAQQWLAAGTRIVWVVWPARRQIDVWEGDRPETPMTVDRDGQVSGGDVLPEFILELARLWP